MNYLLDTNILLLYLREKSGLVAKIDKEFAPLSAGNHAVVSVVSVGEIRSIAIQNKWGSQKISDLFKFLQKFPIADIHVESIIQRYAEIDAFSQGKWNDLPLGTTARNMGKNDLCIAATASVLSLKLLTTDHDFQHLNRHFLEVESIDLVTF
jgi:predicted nucleic acid-binding protein